MEPGNQYRPVEPWCYQPTVLIPQASTFVSDRRPHPSLEPFGILPYGIGTRVLTRGEEYSSPSFPHKNGVGEREPSPVPVLETNPLGLLHHRG